MKTIEKRQVIEKKVTMYVSDDGIEFESESECIKHEIAINNNKGIDWADEHVIGSYGADIINWFADNDDYTIDIVKVDSPEDDEMMSNYYTYDKWCTVDIDRVDSYPTIRYVHSQGSYTRCYSPEKGLDMIKQLFETAKNMAKDMGVELK